MMMMMMMMLNCWCVKFNAMPDLRHITRCIRDVVHTLHTISDLDYWLTGDHGDDPCVWTPCNMSDMWKDVHLCEYGHESSGCTTWWSGGCRKSRHIGDPLVDDWTALVWLGHKIIRIYIYLFICIRPRRSITMNSKNKKLLLMPQQMRKTIKIEKFVWKNSKSDQKLIN